MPGTRSVARAVLGPLTCIPDPEPSTAIGHIPVMSRRDKKCLVLVVVVVVLQQHRLVFCLPATSHTHSLLGLAWGPVRPGSGNGVGRVSPLGWMHLAVPGGELPPVRHASVPFSSLLRSQLL